MLDVFEALFGFSGDVYPESVDSLVNQSKHPLLKVFSALQTKINKVNVKDVNDLLQLLPSQSARKPSAPAF